MLRPSPSSSRRSAAVPQPHLDNPAYSAASDLLLSLPAAATQSGRPAASTSAPAPPASAATPAPAATPPAIYRSPSASATALLRQAAYSGCSTSPCSEPAAPVACPYIASGTPPASGPASPGSPSPAPAAPSKTPSSPQPTARAPAGSHSQTVT